jgi:hypothetical protein
MMVHMRLLIAIPLFPALLVPASSIAQTPRPDQSNPQVNLQTLFEGRLPAPKPGDKPRQIVMRQITIEGHQRAVRLDLPDKGLLLVQLQAGQLATIIDGERRIRLEGEWWTVSLPSAMLLETADDTAVIDTTLIVD